MTPVAHDPQDILDEVVNLGYLNPALHNAYVARDLVVAICRAWGGHNTHNYLRRLLASGHIGDALVALDIYFFGGALTGTTPTRSWPALSELYVEGNIFAEGHRGHAVRPDHAAHGMVSSSERGKTVIYIDAFRPDGCPHTFKEILETLVHEMAHAIYKSFGCRNCNHLDPRVLGPHGHGLLWVKLVEHMRNTIRSWDKALEDFFTEDLVWMHYWKP